MSEPIRSESVFPQLNLFSPERDRTISPVPKPPSPTLKLWEERTLSSVAAKSVPADEQAAYALATTLPQFYADCMGPSPRWDRMGRKTRKSTTAEKDRLALKHWVRATRPEDWPAEQEWGGPSLDFISRAGVDWLSEILERFVSVCGLSRRSVNGLASALRTIVNHAVRVRAIPRVQKMPRIKEGRRLAKIYSPEQIEQIVTSLLIATTLLGPTEYDHSIAVAFLLACRMGARAKDLFALKRDDFSRDVRGRIVVNLQAVKNEEYEHKEQSIPIAPTTWAMIDRNCPPTGLLFANLTSKHQRTARLKSVLTPLGIRYLCPWHACRATCNETLESLKPGVGPFVLGHARSGVNARSYRHPTEDVFRTIYAVEPLRCECRLAGTLAEVSADSYCGCG